jgi:hypothetical protein
MITLRKPRAPPVPHPDLAPFVRAYFLDYLAPRGFRLGARATSTGTWLTLAGTYVRVVAGRYERNTARATVQRFGQPLTPTWTLRVAPRPIAVDPSGDTPRFDLSGADPSDPAATTEAFVYRLGAGDPVDLQEFRIDAPGAYCFVLAPEQVHNDGRPSPMIAALVRLGPTGDPADYQAIYFERRPPQPPFHHLCFFYAEPGPPLDASLRASTPSQPTPAASLVLHQHEPLTLTWDRPADAQRFALRGQGTVLLDGLTGEGPQATWELPPASCPPDAQARYTLLAATSGLFAEAGQLQVRGLIDLRVRAARTDPPELVLTARDGSTAVQHVLARHGRLDPNRTDEFFGQMRPRSRVVYAWTVAGTGHERVELYMPRQVLNPSGATPRERSTLDVTALTWASPSGCGQFEAAHDNPALNPILFDAELRVYDGAEPGAALLTSSYLRLRINLPVPRIASFQLTDRTGAAVPDEASVGELSDLTLRWTLDGDPVGLTHCTLVAELQGPGVSHEQTLKRSGASTTEGSSALTGVTVAERGGVLTLRLQLRNLPSAGHPQGAVIDRRTTHFRLRQPGAAPAPVSPAALRACFDRHLLDRDAHNRDNLTRTAWYLDYASAHPEVPWAMLAHLVSRNAGYQISDLITYIEVAQVAPALIPVVGGVPALSGAALQIALHEVIRFLETGNFLIFYDIYPQLIAYACAKRHTLAAGNDPSALAAADALFDALPATHGVDHAIAQQWKRFFALAAARAFRLPDNDPAVIEHSHLLVANEQNYIEDRLVRPLAGVPAYVSPAVLAGMPAVFSLMAGLEMTKLVFMDGTSRLPTTVHHYTVGDFGRLEDRIQTGRLLFYACFLHDPARGAAIKAWARSGPAHTGSRSDYDPFHYKPSGLASFPLDRMPSHPLVVEGVYPFRLGGPAVARWPGPPPHLRDWSAARPHLIAAMGPPLSPAVDCFSPPTGQHQVAGSARDPDEYPVRSLINDAVAAVRTLIPWP